MATSKTLQMILTLKDDASKKMKGFGNTIKNNKAQIQATGRAFTAVGGIITGTIGLAVKLANEQQKQEVQLQATLESTKGVAGLTSDAVKTLAQDMQELTGIGDETVLAGQNMLLTFTQIGKDVFPQATETLLDMATAMNSGAAPSAEMLKAQAIQLGKALNEPVTGMAALSRVGVKFTDEQKALIETLSESGDIMGAQKVILDELAVEFGGKAAANMQTFGGQLGALKNTFGDFLEQVGAAVIPILKDLVASVKPVVENMIAWAKENPELLKKIILVVGAIGLLMLVLGPLLIILPGIVVAVGIMGTVLGAITLPIGIAIAAVVALVAIFLWLRANWDEVQAFMMAAFDGFKEFIGIAWDAIKGFFVDTWNAIQAFIVAAWEGFKAVGEAIWTGIKDFFLTIWEGIKTLIFDIIPGIVTFIIDKWNFVQDTIDNILTGIKDFFVTIWTNIKDFVINTLVSMKDGVVEKATAIKDAIVDGITTAIDFIKELPGKALDWGKNMITGFIDGIRAMGGKILSAVKAIIPDFIEPYVGFGSPTKKGPGRNIVKWGANMIKGFSEGMQNETKVISDTLKNSLQGALTQAPLGAEGGAGGSTLGFAGLAGAGAGAAGPRVLVTGNTFMGTPEQFASQIEQSLQKKLQGTLKF